MDDGGFNQGLVAARFRDIKARLIDPSEGWAPNFCRQLASGSGLQEGEGAVAMGEEKELRFRSSQSVRGLRLS